MTLAQVLKDATVLPRDLKDPARGLTVDYVHRRIRAAVRANPNLADPAKTDDITAAATTSFIASLPAELTRARTAYLTVWGRVKVDPQHLPLDMKTIRKRVSTRPPTKDPRSMRVRLVISLVYQLIAGDQTLADPANIERLHKLCDRRLRVAERMLYDVGRADHRVWSRSQITSHAGGPWVDGLERLFEYPRVPRAYFGSACHADPTTGVCTAPMTDWSEGGGAQLTGPIRTNPGTRTSWSLQADGYSLFFVTAGGLSATAAVKQLFTPSGDYLSRNLLFCDHTMHALHLEALVFAEEKRGRAAGWLDTELAGHGGGWLRLYAPFIEEPFLASPKEPAHFEYVEVREHDLQVGDHLIVYNHPAYQHATVSGVWKLENALVVQTYPDLRMQGHGSRVYRKGGMWATMVGLFNGELDARRADVDGLAKVTTSVTNAVVVDQVHRLRVGMKVEVADPVTDAVVAANRQITALDAGTRQVTYDGASVSVPAGHVLRRPRMHVGTFDGIDVEGLTMLRRVPSSLSTFAGRHLRADWHLIWEADSDEDAIRTNPTRAAFTKATHLVDYTVETINGATKTIGWFPLWRPALKGKAPVLVGGKIVATEPVTVGPKNIAGWTWFLDPDPAKADLVPVIRPREP